MRYVFQEAEIDIPGEFRDNSVNVIVVTLEDGSSLSITINRRPSGPDDTIERLMEADLEFAHGEDDGFERLWTRPHTVDGRTAAIAALRLHSGDGAAEQRVVYIKAEATLLKLTATVSNAFTQQQLAALNTIASSFRFTAAS
ncbi:hypothetical protein AA23498_3225 [Acetobacter nitrogenifigens DSM 23921 = NBRC 105050]|uniref:DUF1795 domain-containing protein n=1 Tax=Acetobacter nitrogenifigens DSM 23921 = NBRC 105050 TaxID=1120919 RepID=A0A511X5Q0_9PROT|nr:DcrB-related protein [Acetobacter nitrogenifigens]GBQ98434.1 hypothetical protein AA23498_3225 [Acetobacter nitrogenifigens DSM 23921 = NBRC 105050]GEN58278.1 hypothetical protein ANI02nite_01620 [Acetobacter nitrogenifigens DSM 23921 = NBRC 105050]